MASNAVKGLGAKIKFNGNYIGDVKKIGAVEDSVETYESTDLDSTRKEYINLIPDAGSVEIEGHFYAGDTNGQVALRSAVGGVAYPFVIEYPASLGASLEFTGLVTKFGIGEATPEGAIMFTATVKVTGEVTANLTASTGLTTPFLALSDSGDLVPAAANATLKYTYTVDTAVSSITVTPTATAGVIKVNGVIVATGVASGSIALGAAGSLTDIEIEVRETGKVPVNYVITVVRAIA